MAIKFSLFLVVLVFHLISAHRNYRLAKGQMTFREAINYCNGLKMEMIDIEDHNINYEVNMVVKRNGLECLWIDGRDEITETVWLNSDNKELSFKFWHPTEPNGGSVENCISVRNDQYWYDTSCFKQCSVACQRFDAKTNKLTFKIASTQMNFEDAVSHCESQEMELVKIINPVMNMDVLNLAVTYKLGPYWIDGNDKTKETNWVDSNNTTLLFLNWQHTEPNGARKDNCIQGLGYPNGAWDDTNCASLKAVICAPSTYKKMGSMTFQYAVKTIGVNFTEAEKYCQERNMEIVTIDSNSTNQDILNLIVRKNIYSYWIKGHYQSPQIFKYPSVNDTRRYFTSNFNQTCLAVQQYRNWTTVHVPCSYFHSVVCRYIPRSSVITKPIRSSP